MIKLIAFLVVAFLAASAHAAQFSENSCIVMREYTPSVCFAEREKAESHVEFISDTQVVFSSFEDAINQCPFEPMLIEISGTVYISPDAQLQYSGTKDITIRGVSQQMSTGEIQKSTLIGFKELLLTESGISVTFENFIMEGCGMEAPLFSWENSGCLVNQSLSVSNMEFLHFRIDNLLCQYSDAYITTFSVVNSLFVQNSGTSIYADGADNIFIVGNVFYVLEDNEATQVILRSGSADVDRFNVYNNEIRKIVEAKLEKMSV